MSEPDAPAPQNFPEMRVALRSVFQGCTVEESHGSGSASMEIHFGEYEVRVMLIGHGKSNWVWHVRFQQQIELADRKRPTKPVKRILQEMQSPASADAVQAIQRAKAYLLGQVHSIQSALRPRTSVKAEDVGDIFHGG